MNDEYWSVCQISTPITSRPTAPAPSIRLRAPAVTFAAQLAARPDHRQRRAEEQLEGAGVGAVVDPRGVEARVVEDRHQDRRGGGEDQRRHGQPRPHPRRRARALLDQAHPAEQHERPEDVELLLDRQRPEMAERFRRAEAGEVGDVLEDQLPVADVERGGNDRVAELVGLGGPEDRHPGDDDEPASGRAPAAAAAPGPARSRPGACRAAPCGRAGCR